MKATDLIIPVILAILLGFLLSNFFAGLGYLLGWMTYAVGKKMLTSRKQNRLKR